MTIPISDAMIRRAIVAQISSIMSSTDIWGSPAYTVYDMDTQDSTIAEPTRPFAFVGTTRSGNIPRWLPAIVVETSISRVNYELGSMGDLVSLGISVIPRNEGELSAICEAIKGYFQYLDPGDDIERGVEEEWSERSVPVPYDAAMSASLRYWTLLENSIIFTDRVVPAPVAP
jgi:hypothetical protein